MKLIFPPAKAVAKSVEGFLFDRNWRAAKRVGREMVAWLDDAQGSFVGKYRNAWAISHAQVCAEPLAMFVITQEFIAKDDGRLNHVNTLWRSRIIFNPVILETPDVLEVQVPKRNVKRVAHDKVEVETTIETVRKPNLYTPAIKEACMSFPYRSGRSIKRLFRIKVAYDIIGFFGQRKHVEEWIEGVKAHIFQHEVMHQHGLDMYHA